MDSKNQVPFHNILTNMVRIKIERRAVIEAFAYGNPNYGNYCVLLDSSGGPRHGHGGEDVHHRGPRHRLRHPGERGVWDRVGDIGVKAQALPLRQGLGKKEQ